LSGSSQHRFLGDIPGQKAATELLSSAIGSARVASAYLFRGPMGVGKFAAAVDFVRWLKCDTPESCDASCHSCRLINSFNHPDLIIVIPLPTEISQSVNKTAAVLQQVAADRFMELSFEKPASIGIDEIRGLSERLALAPARKGGRWAIIRDADMMTPEAANAFLKTLEEPPKDAHLILTSSRPDFLFPTIRSRTQPVRFNRLSRAQITEMLISRDIEQKEAEKIALAAEGSITTALAMDDEQSGEIKKLGEELWVILFSKSDSAAIDLVEKLGRDRSLARAVIASAMSFLRDHMLTQLGVAELVVNTEQKQRFMSAAQKFPNTEPLGNTIKFLQEKTDSLRFNPQYDLFWMDLIIRGRRIASGR